MHVLLKSLIFILFLTKTHQNNDTHRAGRRLLDFRKMMKVFVRYNVKVNVVPYTSLFAFAMGFRGNWDIVPAEVLHSMKKISQEKDRSGQKSAPSQYPYHYPVAQYQRAIHSSLQKAFDWHGFNGTACLQRTFCEVSLINHDDIISRIFKTIFNSTEEYRCSEDLPCPFSFLDFVDHVLTGNVNVQT